MSGESLSRSRRRSGLKRRAFKRAERGFNPQQLAFERFDVARCLIASLLKFLKRLQNAAQVASKRLNFQGLRRDFA